MSTIPNLNTAYGFNQSLLNIPPQPIISSNVPGINNKAQLGTIWINKSAQTSYILTAIANNSAIWEPVGGGGGVNTVNANSGSATGSGGAMSFVGGPNISTSGSSSTVTISLGSTVSVANTVTAGTGLIATTGNVVATAGNIVLPATSTSSTGAIVAGTVPVLQYTGTGNIFVGANTANFTTTGTNNALYGAGACAAITTGSQNVVLGNQAAKNATTFSNNIIAGYQAGNNYTTSESSNIIIGNSGTILDANTIRIGTQGSGTGQQNIAFMAGINGNTVSNAKIVTINSSTNQLGTVSSGSSLVTWSAVTGATALVTGNGYIVNGGSTVNFTLPVIAAVGDTFNIRVLDTAVGGWKINQNASQYILSNNTSGASATKTTTGVTGNIATAAGSPFVGGLLVCITANTAFTFIDYSGTTIVYT